MTAQRVEVDPVTFTVFLAVLKQRDQARAIAVELEQQLAVAEALLAAEQ